MGQRISLTGLEVGQRLKLGYCGASANSVATTSPVTSASGSNGQGVLKKVVFFFAQEAGRAEQDRRVFCAPAFSPHLLIRGTPGRLGIRLRGAEEG